MCKGVKYSYCDDKDCKRIHTIKTTTKCKFFMKNRFCKQNEKCNFSHDIELDNKSNIKDYHDNINKLSESNNSNYLSYNDYLKEIKLYKSFEINNLDKLMNDNLKKLYESIEINDLDKLMNEK